MSNNALNILDEEERQTGEYSQRGMVVAGRVCGMIGTGFFFFALLVLLARGCGQSQPTSSSHGGPYGTTVTIDGRPATPEEKEMILKQTQHVPLGQPSSQPPIVPK